MKTLTSSRGPAHMHTLRHQTHKGLQTLRCTDLRGGGGLRVERYLTENKLPNVCVRQVVLFSNTPITTWATTKMLRSALRFQLAMLIGRIACTPSSHSQSRTRRRTPARHRGRAAPPYTGAQAPVARHHGCSLQKDTDQGNLGRCEPLLRVELQQLFQKVQSRIACSRIHRLPVYWWGSRESCAVTRHFMLSGLRESKKQQQTFKELFCLLAHMTLGPKKSRKRDSHTSETKLYLILNRRIPNLGNDHFEHINIILARKQWLSSKKLRQYAADGPHINALVIVLLTQQKLRGTIPGHSNSYHKAYFIRL